MLTDWAWRGGRVTLALRLGVPGGVLFGGFKFASGESVALALFSGVFFAIVFGATMAYLAWGKLNRADDLSGDDRAVITRAVQRGEAVTTPELAREVVRYSEEILQVQDRDRRYAWVLWGFAAMTLVLAVVLTGADEMREAGVMWALVAFWVVFLMWLPGRRSRTEANARRAAELARRPVSDA